MATTVKNTILSVTRRTKKGFTVGEIFDRVSARFAKGSGQLISYSGVRARVAELLANGSLTVTGERRDPVTLKTVTTYRRATSNNNSSSSFSSSN